MEFKLVKVVFKNIKLQTKEGKEFILTNFYLKAEGVKPIKVVPKDKEDYALFEALCSTEFSEVMPKVKDNSGDLLK